MIRICLSLIHKKEWLTLVEISCFKKRQNIFVKQKQILILAKTIEFFFLNVYRHRHGFVNLQGISVIYDNGYVLLVVILYVFMTYHRMCNQSNTMVATNGAGTAFHSEAPILPQFLVGIVLFILQFSVQCFMNNRLSF